MDKHTFEFHYCGIRHEVETTLATCEALKLVFAERSHLRAMLSLPAVDKIVKVGRIDPRWSREFDCTACGALVVIERSDLTVRRVHDIYGRRQVASAKAPCCGTTIKVADPVDSSWGDLPTAVTP
jgi:hypothetical protein